MLCYFVSCLFLDSCDVYIEYGGVYMPIYSLVLNILLFLSAHGGLGFNLLACYDCLWA